MVITQVLCALRRRESRNPRLNVGCPITVGILCSLLPFLVTLNGRTCLQKGSPGEEGLQRLWALLLAAELGLFLLKGESDMFRVGWSHGDLPLTPCQFRASSGRALPLQPEQSGAGSRMGEKAWVLPLGEMEAEPAGTPRASEPMWCLLDS